MSTFVAIAYAVIASQLLAVIAVFSVAAWEEFFKDLPGRIWNALRLPRPVALQLRAFGATEGAYTWEDWQADARKTHPVRYFLFDTLPRFVRVKWSRVSHVWYWIRTHTYNRYHMLDMRNPCYSWGWVDRSSCILYAPFNLLKDFVEKEKAFDCHVDWQGTDHHSKAAAEMRELYEWWTKERWEEHKRFDDRDWDYRDPTWYKEHDAEETRLEDKDTEMLIRLIKVRGYMWT